MKKPNRSVTALLALMAVVGAVVTSSAGARSPAPGGSHGNDTYRPFKD